MPIYPYRCTSCQKSKDVLQKMSDTPLTLCPFCGQEAFEKQLSAAGFQLKGQGWYATDFRNPPAQNSTQNKIDALPNPSSEPTENKVSSTPDTTSSNH